MSGAGRATWFPPWQRAGRPGQRLPDGPQGQVITTLLLWRPYCCHLTPPLLPPPKLIADSHQKIYKTVECIDSRTKIRWGKVVLKKQTILTRVLVFFIRYVVLIKLFVQRKEKDRRSIISDYLLCWVCTAQLSESCPHLTPHWRLQSPPSPSPLLPRLSTPQLLHPS